MAAHQVLEQEAGDLDDVTVSETLATRYKWLPGYIAIGCPRWLIMFEGGCLGDDGQDVLKCVMRYVEALGA